MTRLILQTRLRTAFWITLVVVPAVIVWAIFFADPVRSVTQVTGTVVGLHQTQSETPGPTKLVVQLDTGATVITGGVYRVLFQKGRRAILAERVTTILGRLSYSFVRYLEPDEEPPQ